jgi:hypothetical protein
MADFVVGGTLEVAAFDWKQIELRIIHQLNEQVSFLLQEWSQPEVGGPILQKFCQRYLLWGITAESIELMHFSEFRHKWFWGNTIAYFPTGAVVNFSERKAGKAAFS